MKRQVWINISLLILMLFISGCSGIGSSSVSEGNITIAVDESLKDVFDNKIISHFNNKYPKISATVIYGSSSDLVKRMETSADVDMFLMASVQDMDRLIKRGWLDESNISPLLRNYVTMICSTASDFNYTEFKDMTKADSIAIANPDRVEVGKCTQQILTDLGIWDQIADRVSYASSGGEVLNWVKSGRCAVGTVYSMTAKSAGEEIRIISEEKSVGEEGVFNIGIVKQSKNQPAVTTFVSFLKTKDIAQIFSDTGLYAED